MSNEVRTLNPVTFFGGDNTDPFAVTDFTPQQRDPKAPEPLFEMPEPSPADLAAVEALAQQGLTEDPEAGITKQVDGQMTLPLDIPGTVPVREPEPTEPDTGKKSSGKVPPA